MPYWLLDLLDIPRTIVGFQLSFNLACQQDNQTWYGPTASIAYSQSCTSLYNFSMENWRTDENGQKVSSYQIVNYDGNVWWVRQHIITSCS